MIQFNLLPDIKQQYIKAKRQKHTTVVVSMLVASSTLFIFVLLFLTVHLWQTRQLNTVNKAISTKTDTLKKTKDLDKILTIQNQLVALPKLHDDKPVASRLYTYLSQVTPTSLNIGELEVNFTDNTMKVTGTADSLLTVNKFVDTMKFTTYSDGTPLKAGEKAPNPFSKVVLGTFTRTDEGTTYQVTLSYESAIFARSKNIVLTVPKITSTRSETEKPENLGLSDLFQALPEVKKQ